MQANIPQNKQDFPCKINLDVVSDESLLDIALWTLSVPKVRLNLTQLKT